MTDTTPLTESELKREEAHAFQDGCLSRKQFWTHEEVRRMLVTIRSLQVSDVEPLIGLIERASYVLPLYYKAWHEDARAALAKIDAPPTEGGS